MKVRFMNNDTREVDEIDVAYLFQQTRLTCAAIQSDSIFTMFEAYMKRHSLDYDPEPIDEWDENFIEQFTSIETLNHLIRLAKRTSQAALLELCQQRFAQLQVSASASDTDNYGDDSDQNNSYSGNSGGDDSNDSDQNSDDDDSGNSGGDSHDGDDSDHNSDDAGNNGEDNSDDSDRSNDYDTNSGNGSDEVDDMGNQVEDLSDQELSVCGSDDAGNPSVEVSSSSSNDTNNPEVSNDSGGGKVDNMDSIEDLSMELANSAGCEAAVVKRIFDEGGNMDEDEKGRI